VNTVEQVELSDVFRLVSKPKFVLGTTYTLSLAFFESVLWQYINRSNLASCLIIADPNGYDRSITEGGALQRAGQDYQVVRAPIPACFHPKVWIFVGDGKAVLLVGSGNLTQAGFVKNAEMFDVVTIDAENPAPATLLTSMQTFTSGLSGMWPKADTPHLLCIETLEEITDQLSKLPTKPDNHDDPRFLHTFNGPLVDQLPAIPDAHKFYIASPFFGGATDGLDLLHARFPQTELSIFPGIHDGNATDIPLSKVSTNFPNAQVAALKIPSKERRHAHLKLYAIDSTTSEAVIFCGSANCTKAAWQRPNVEAGLLRHIPSALLPSYFEADDLELPTNALSYTGDEHRTGILPIFASDEGTHLRVAVAAAEASSLPLTEAKFTVRCGSHISPYQMQTVFRDGRTANIEWTAFQDWERRRNLAMCLEIEGKTPKGDLVHGRCFVENRPLLTVDPLHRSAWRAALALLEEEGTPELADIAAIFSLAEDVLSGTLVKAARKTENAPAGGRPENEERESTSIPVWPPQPDLSDLRSRMGNTAAGRLQWFQRIFQVFLPSHEAPDGSPQNSPRDRAGDDHDDGSNDQERTEAEIERSENAAQRIWKRAYQDYDRMYDKLFQFMPNKENADYVWPAAVFALLSLLATLRSVGRLTSTTDLRPKKAEICDEFLRLMLSDRKQHDDFCCPIHYRYRSEKFPPLADDLRKVFQIRPHKTFSEILLALITDQALRAESPLPDMLLQRRVGQVCRPGFHLDIDTIETCRRVWSKYIKDDNLKLADSRFAAMLTKLPLPAPEPTPA